MTGSAAFRDFLRLFFPKLCAGCGSALRTREQHICTNCRLNLPETLYPFNNENPIARVFWGRIPLLAATSLLHFQKGSAVQQIMHELKYNGNKFVGVELGQVLGSRIKSYAQELPDLIVPVPLHPKRERKRGYNQSLMIANGIENATGVPVRTDILIRNTYTTTQTNKGRTSRWDNVETIFGIRNADMATNKHILLVDDVLTTGATLEACGAEILKVPGVRLSIATLACA